MAERLRHRLDPNRSREGKERKPVTKARRRGLITSASDGSSRSFVYSDELTVGSQRTDKLALMPTVATSEGHQRIRSNTPAAICQAAANTKFRRQTSVQFTWHAFKVFPGGTGCWKIYKGMKHPKTNYNVPTVYLTRSFSPQAIITSVWTMQQFLIIFIQFIWAGSYGSSLIELKDYFKIIRGMRKRQILE